MRRNKEEDDEDGGEKYTEKVIRQKMERCREEELIRRMETVERQW